MHYIIFVTPCDDFKTRHESIVKYVFVNSALPRVNFNLLITLNEADLKVTLIILHKNYLTNCISLAASKHSGYLKFTQIRVQIIFG